METFFNSIAGTLVTKKSGAIPLNFLYMVHNFLGFRQSKNDFKPVSEYSVFLDANSGNLVIIFVASRWTLPNV